MQYFDQAADKYDRLDKVIGDLFAVAIVVALIAVFTSSMMFR